MLVSDENVDLKETCQITPATALGLLEPLHALIDKEIQSKEHAISDKHLNLCSDNCHCGVYSDITPNKYLKDELFKKAQTFPKKQLVICAQKTAKWFCHDQLLRNLKSELTTSPIIGQ